MSQTPISGDEGEDSGLNRRTVLKSTSGAAAGIVGFAGHAKASTSTEEIIEERLQNGGIPVEELLEFGIENLNFQAMSVPKFDSEEIRQQEGSCICGNWHCDCHHSGADCESCTCELHKETVGVCPHACSYTYRCKWNCSCGW